MRLENRASGIPVKQGFLDAGLVPSCTAEDSDRGLLENGSGWRSKAESWIEINREAKKLSTALDVTSTQVAQGTPKCCYCERAIGLGLQASVSGEVIDVFRKKTFKCSLSMRIIRPILVPV